MVIQNNYTNGLILITKFPSTNKTDRNDIPEIVLKVALKTITLTPSSSEQNTVCVERQLFSIDF
jgi:hypothetical protein